MSTQDRQTSLTAPGPRPMQDSALRLSSGGIRAARKAVGKPLAQGQAGVGELSGHLWTRSVSKRSRQPLRHPQRGRSLQLHVRSVVLLVTDDKMVMFFYYENMIKLIIFRSAIGSGACGETHRNAEGP